MRTIVISDIHGYLDKFNELLDKVNFKKNDNLILIGDYIDRGTQSKGVINKIKKLVENENVIALKGNHEDTFVKVILNEISDESLYMWLFYHGGHSTLVDYYGYNILLHSTNVLSTARGALQHIKEEYIEDIKFLESLNLYYEDNKHIYVHAGVNPIHKDWKTTRKEDFLFIRDYFIKSNLKYTKKTVIFGHTPCLRIHNNSNPFFDYQNGKLIKIGIDGGMGFKKQLNALIIEKGKYSYKSVSY